MFAFTAEVWQWRGPSPYHFVTVPADTRWPTSLFPKDGGYVLPLKDAVRRAEGCRPGDRITVELTVRGL